MAEPRTFTPRYPLGKYHVPIGTYATREDACMAWVLASQAAPFFDKAMRRARSDRPGAI
jgi:hypothetical protein